MGGEEDFELEEIRRRKLAELQQQQQLQAEAQERAETVEAQRQTRWRPQGSTPNRH